MRTEIPILNCRDPIVYQTVYRHVGTIIDKYRLLL